MRHVFPYLTSGLLFGFILSRIGATDYDTIAGMFTLSDLQLWGVLGVAVLVAGAGQALFKRRSAAGHPMPVVTPKPMKPALVAGSILFGAGWAVTGTCPGTGLAQIGEGKLMGIVTIAGIFAGSALYRRFGDSIEAKLSFGKTPPSTPIPSCTRHD